MDNRAGFSLVLLFSICCDKLFDMWRKPSGHRQLNKPGVFSCLPCNSEFFLLHQYSVSNSFMKASCSIESKALSVNYLYSDIKSLIDPSCTSNGSLSCVWFVTLHTAHLKNNDLLSQKDLWNVDTFAYTVFDKSPSLL